MKEMIRAAATRYLPTVIAVMLVFPVVEALLRGHGIADQFRGISVRLAVLEPLALAIGYFVGLNLARLWSAAPARGFWNVAAGVVSIVILGGASILTQGISVPSILMICVGVGTLSGMAVCMPLRTAHA